MKQIFLCLLMGLYCTLRAQQVPQFKNLTPTTDASAASQGIFWNYTGSRNQSLYYPSEFSGATSGFISHLYFRARNDVSSNFFIKNLIIRMGYMPEKENSGDSMRFHPSPPYNLYPTDTVFYSAQYTFNAPIDSGDWIKFTLQTPFYYNTAKNFILDIMQDSVSTPYFGLKILAYVEINPVYSPRTYYVQHIFTPGQGWSWGGNATASYRWIFGFDLAPTSINDGSQIADLQLYPNPTEGRFTISFNAQKKVNELMLTVTNVTGSIISQQQYRQVSGKFSKEMDISKMAKGVYFVEIKADGEKRTRKVVVQ